MPDAPEPPRKFYDLKAREFERVNPPVPWSVPPPLPNEPPGPPKTTSSAGRVDLHEMIGHAATPGPLLSKEGVPNRPNQVHGILRENFDREQEAGAFATPDVRRRPSRRLRDYLFLMFTVNPLLGFVAYRALHQGNAILFVYAIAGLGAFVAAATWLMWFVMDRY